MTSPEMTRAVIELQRFGLCLDNAEQAALLSRESETLKRLLVERLQNFGSSLGGSV